jgi:hypothetical protein
MAGQRISRTQPYRLACLLARTALRLENMANQLPSRNITIQSNDTVRWQRPFNRLFFGFIILILCINFATWNAPQIVHTVEGVVFLVGFIGLTAVAIVLGVKSMQHFRLVFTIHWTEPKGIRRVLTRRYYKQIGLAACLRWSVLWGLAVSGPLALIWLLSWGTAQMDPTKRALSSPWALAFILLPGIGFAALPFLGNFLDAVFSAKTIGLDDEWMGYLQGRPGKALWRYEQIASVRFEPLRVGEREFRLMIVTPHEGQEVAFGLSDEMDVRQITDFLAGKGVSVSEV